MNEELSDDFYDAIDDWLVFYVAAISHTFASLADFTQPEWEDAYDMLCLWDGIT